jgi:hypothetical protein
VTPQEPKCFLSFLHRNRMANTGKDFDGNVKSRGFELSARYQRCSGWYCTIGLAVKKEDWSPPTRISGGRKR